MNISVDGDNSFHTGWLACFLGLPNVHPCAEALKWCDRRSFYEGWNTCNETPIGYREQAFREMLALNQAEAIWVDDDNNEIMGSMQEKRR